MKAALERPAAPADRERPEDRHGGRPPRAKHPVGRGASLGVPLDPARSFDEGLPMSRLLIRYVLACLVTVALVTLVTAYASRQLGTDEAIHDATNAASIAASAAVEPSITDELLDLDPDAIAMVDDVVRHHVLGRQLVRVKLWAADGTIVYSDEPRLIGEQFEFDDGAAAVLWGDPDAAEAEVSDLSGPENRFEEPAVQLLEVYLPVYTPDGTPMLFEAYFRYDGVTQSGRRAWLRFAPVTLGSIVFLGLLQVPLIVSLARRLRSTQRQRERLLQRTIDAADAERRRIASDLHDGVVQDLAGVTFALAATSRRLDEPQRTEVSQSATQLRDAIRSLRSLLVEIYPPNLYEEGLDAALSDLTARIEPRGIRTELRIDGDIARLPLDATRLLYRTAQEGLRNVVSHAEATRARIDIRTQPDRVVLRVIDDGRGFDPEDAPDGDGHLGLRALAGLASSIGASVTIESTAGKGTELRVEVPRDDQGDAGRRSRNRSTRAGTPLRDG